MDVTLLWITKLVFEAFDTLMCDCVRQIKAQPSAKQKNKKGLLF